MLSVPSPTVVGPTKQGPWALSDLLSGRNIYVAANRGPARYRLLGDGLESTLAAGGLATALSWVSDHLPLTWIATAMEPGDRLAASCLAARRAVPGSPRLSFVNASEEAIDWFYHHFANPVLWFLQHGMWDLLRRPDMSATIERGWMLGYRPINEAFARVIEQEVHGLAEPVVLIQDYHLYLLPGLLRKRVPGALLQHFTHIPWPAPDAWEPLLPTIRREICLGPSGQTSPASRPGPRSTTFCAAAKDSCPALASTMSRGRYR